MKTTINDNIIRYSSGRSYVRDPAAFMALEDFAKTIAAIKNKIEGEAAMAWDMLNYYKLLTDKKSDPVAFINSDRKWTDVNKNVLAEVKDGILTIPSTSRNYLKDYAAAKALLSYLEPMLIGMMYSTEFDTVYVATLSPISILTEGSEDNYVRRETIEEAAPFKGSGSCEAEALSLAILAYVEGTNETLSLQGIRGNYNAPNKERFSKLLRLNMLLGETSSLLTG